MIKFENVTATYTHNVGIFNLTFHIPKGELVFLMGPTGAGKSTVLRTIYRDIPISAGALYINGEDIRFSDGLNTKVESDSVIDIVPSMAGG